MRIPPDATPQHRFDVRRRALIITLLGTLLIGMIVAALPSANAPAKTPAAQSPATLRFADVLPMSSQGTRHSAEQQKILNLRFEQGVAMLHMRQYEYALTAFHQVLAIAPTLPEAHVNMGFTLLGLEQWQSARDFFSSAIELRREQLNAYYGLAVALEALGDMPGAIGAMQSYLHRAPEDDAYRKSGEAALWEWREKDRVARNVAPAGE